MMVALAFGAKHGDGFARGGADLGAKGVGGALQGGSPPLL